MGEARGHRRRHTVGVQGTPAIFIFIFYFTDFDLTPSSPNMFPSTENALMCHFCLPQLTRAVPHLLNMKNTPLGVCFRCLAHSHILNTRTCPCGHVLVFPLSLPHFELLSSRLEHQNEPVWACSDVHA